MQAIKTVARGSSCSRRCLAPRLLAASRLSTGARIGNHIRPPIIGKVLLRVRPRTLSNSLARLQYRGDKSR